MPQHKSCEKRIRQDEKKRLRNRIHRSKMRTAIKNVRNAETKETALDEYKKTVSILDSMSLRGIIHKNKAANLKRKLNKHIQSL